jgi:N-6 DNA Methylase
MAKLDFPSFEKHLAAFDFPRLFVEVLGWNQAPAERQWQTNQAGDTAYSHRTVAELGGVVAIQVVAEGGWPDETQRLQVWKHVVHRHAENLLIFTNTQDKASQSQWYWVKRDKHPETGKPRLTARRHDYFKGQPVDLFASKLQAMVVELGELDSAGRLPVLEAARRIAAALDVDKTTKKFFTAYQQQHLELLKHIQGIDNDHDKRWYASVLLNRLMFVWFLQKKGFLANQSFDYLRDRLGESERRAPNRFFGEFLNALFFEAFAKPESDRSTAARALTGAIPYLNGGLFLHHKLELDANRNSRIGTTLTVADAAFKGIFELFASFSWHLDDTPGGDADEINPDVLGYIFEKYINQKAFGAYYTRPEITSYLAERSIHKLILERVHQPAIPELKLKEISFDSVPELLARMDTHTALKLVNEVLPSITILDPAVGSGAFLVAALKALINVYYAVVGRAELGASSELQAWLRAIQKDHPSVGYFIKRRIVTDNLHGVDIMEEACEIAKLRLFLAMVSSVRKVEDLEPLPNIDFNILPGNSLVGLMRVDEHEFDRKQDDLFKPPFRELLVAKNRKLDAYRHAAERMGRDVNLRGLRDDIDAEMQHASGVMNELMRDQFEALGVKFEQAQWDATKKKLGKPKKRRIERQDIDAQTPFHWGYVFDDIVQRRGGFDIVLANPPWEVFQTDEKEFFQQYDQTIQKNSLRIEDWTKQFDKLMRNVEIREAWLGYVNRFPHMSRWYKQSPDYRNQTSSKINLYLLFVERCFHLLRPSGHAGIVIPSGIYTDLGAKGLRDLLFEQTQIEGLFCFENRKTIFEGVDSRFKFVVLTFEKTANPRLQVVGEKNASAAPSDLLAPQVVDAAGGGGTTHFPAAFMRHDVAELARFPGEGALMLDVALVKRLSPDSHSVMEFKSALDVQIAEKMLAFPLLGERIEGTWNLSLTSEFNMTTDSHLFKTEPGPGRVPLYEGKMIWQFDASYAKPRYWVDAKACTDILRTTALRKLKQLLRAQPGVSPEEAEGLVEQASVSVDAEQYRFGFRDVARNTDARSMMCAILPRHHFAGNTVNLQQPWEFVVKGRAWRQNVTVTAAQQSYVCGILNGFVVDWLLRQKITAHLNMFYVYQVPLPRDANEETERRIAQRAARLICTTPEFDDLAQTVGLEKTAYATGYGTTDPTERARLRAELDGLVAHLYGLSDAEFTHILGTFPLVAHSVKQAALKAYRDVAQGLVA